MYFLLLLIQSNPERTRSCAWTGCAVCHYAMQLSRSQYRPSHVISLNPYFLTAVDVMTGRTLSLCCKTFCSNGSLVSERAVS